MLNRLACRFLGHGDELHPRAKVGVRGALVVYRCRRCGRTGSRIDPDWFPRKKIDELVREIAEAEARRIIMREAGRAVARATWAP